VRIIFALTRRLGEQRWLCPRYPDLTHRISPLNPARPSSPCSHPSPPLFIHSHATRLVSPALGLSLTPSPPTFPIPLARPSSSTPQQSSHCLESTVGASRGHRTHPAALLTLPLPCPPVPSGRPPVLAAIRRATIVLDGIPALAGNLDDRVGFVLRTRLHCNQHGWGAR